MPIKKLSRITGYAEPPTNTWTYICDTDDDIATLPPECTIAIIAEPADGKSAVRIRNASGTFKELG